MERSNTASHAGAQQARTLPTHEYAQWANAAKWTHGQQLNDEWKVGARPRPLGGITLTGIVTRLERFPVALLIATGTRV